MHVPLDRRAAASFGGWRRWGPRRWRPRRWYPPPRFPRRGAPGQTSRVILGFIGTGGRSRQLMDHARGGRIVATSDCVSADDRDCCGKRKPIGKPMLRSDDRRREARRRGRRHARTTVVLPCIHACQAGLDVYAEKRYAHDRRGRRLVQHARKHKTVFQLGSQQRTMEMNRFACELVLLGAGSPDQGRAGLPRALAPATTTVCPANPCPGNGRSGSPAGRLPAFNHALQFGWTRGVAGLLGRRDDDQFPRRRPGPVGTRCSARPGQEIGRSRQRCGRHAVCQVPRLFPGMSSIRARWARDFMARTARSRSTATSS